MKQKKKVPVSSRVSSTQIRPNQVQSESVSHSVSQSCLFVASPPVGTGQPKRQAERPSFTRA